MVIFALLLAGGLLAVLLRRRARRSELAGLNATKPVFSVEPPTRSVGSRKTEAL